MIFSHHFSFFRFGMDMIYEGDLWTMVTFSAILVKAGINVMVVAPEPITATFLLA